MSRIKWSKEPVAWITLAVVILTLVNDYLTHQLDLNTAVKVLSEAVGGVVIRRTVFAPANVVKVDGDVNVER